MPAISRREQAELDELLSDIYRGIETLPDHRSHRKVKHVNTNKLIYHQEKDFDRHRASDSENEDDDIDGATRSEWLNHQLGRASIGWSTREMKERQIKEKAMIEELKRSLTLKQSSKGKKNSRNNKVTTSSSQISMNQPNKTILLSPNTPPAPSPMTPIQQLRAASCSLSPSPAPMHPYASKTLGHQHQPSHQQQQYVAGQRVLHGTRTVGRQPSQPATHKSQPTTQSQQSQYSNPHASLMQHRMEQQSKVSNGNSASIREFNELDSLLRSLSLGVPAYSSTQVTPGYSNKPAQASLGGYMPASYQQQLQQQQVPAPSPQSRPNTSDLYAKVQKQQPTIIAQSQPQQPQQQPHQQQQQQRAPGSSFSGASQPYTIDVSDKKIDENCIERQRQRQDVSEFEVPIELLPSMEDYQNIGKLNPVKNYYWYKPNMSREMAIHLLKDKPQGTFIVRDSTSFKGAYGLAVRVSKLPRNILANMRNTNSDQAAEYIRHFLIEPVGSGVRLKGYANEPVFDSLPDLIYQHSLTELALPCKLIIPRADIEDPRFNQKQKQFFDEFIASKEQAKHQPYERTSPDGGYRRYPGNVLIHNEHRIIFQ